MSWRTHQNCLTFLDVRQSFVRGLTFPLRISKKYNRPVIGFSEDFGVCSSPLHEITVPIKIILTKLWVRSRDALGYMRRKRRWAIMFGRLGRVLEIEETFPCPLTSWRGPCEGEMSRTRKTRSGKAVATPQFSFPSFRGFPSCTAFLRQVFAPEEGRVRVKMGGGRFAVCL